MTDYYFHSIDAFETSTFGSLFIYRDVVVVSVLVFSFVFHLGQQYCARLIDRNTHKGSRDRIEIFRVSVNETPGAFTVCNLCDGNVEQTECSGT